MSTTNIEFADGKVILANDNDCCTEAIEILSDVWDWSCHGGTLPRNRIGAFLAAKGVIDSDVELFDGYRQTNNCPNYLRS